MPDMSARHRKTLTQIFEKPIRSSIHWSDIEALFNHLEAEITEGKGSRVRVALGGQRAVFHRPHPQKETDKGAVSSVREFLERAGVTP
jgi:HicA toxin of bacterial toxin-antitoxin,